jgi:hypothetical protein
MMLTLGKEQMATCEHEKVCIALKLLAVAMPPETYM